MWLELQEEVFHMSYFFKEFRRQCWFLVYLTSVLISCVFRRQYWFLVYFDVSTDFFCISTSVLISCVFRRQYWFLLHFDVSTDFLCISTSVLISFVLTCFILLENHKRVSTSFPNFLTVLFWNRTVLSVNTSKTHIEISKMFFQKDLISV